MIAMRLRAAVFVILVFGCRERAAQTPRGESRQTVDSAFSAGPTDTPMFARGAGPRVVIDQAHANFHTASGRYAPFKRLLEQDGFVVDSNVRPFDPAVLSRVRILVISNAVHPSQRDVKDWHLPTPSAFTDAEIDAVRRWVNGGGALLLIADHMPFAGAASQLGSALGIRFFNGFALADSVYDQATGDYPLTFRRADGGLADHPITNGTSPRARIDSVTSFTGSAFALSGAHRPGALLRLAPNIRVRLPQRAWVFSDSAPVVSERDLLQGAAFTIGTGRVAVFGEAAMFTAQRKGVSRSPMGMNAPAAGQNAQFVLNTMRWLAGALTRPSIR